MSKLDSVFDAVGTTERAIDWGNQDAITQIDRVEASVTFYAGGERVVTLTASGDTIPTLGSIHDLTAAMESLFSMKIASELVEQGFSVEDAQEALGELDDRYSEDVLGIEGI